MKTTDHLTNSLQYNIVNRLTESHPSLRQYSLLDACYIIFKNFTVYENNCKGLRLTTLGYNLLKKNFDSYSFSIEKGTIKNKLKLTLHDKMKWPYYIDNKQLVLFSEDDAMWLKIVSNNVDKFAEGLD